LNIVHLFLEQPGTNRDTLTRKDKNMFPQVRAEAPSALSFPEFDLPASPGPATLAFVGDVMLGRRVSATFGARAAESHWGDVLPVLRSADAVVANLECPITQSDTPWRRTVKSFRFRADPRAVDVLRAANIRCVNLANNHALDYSEQGLYDTFTHLDAAGIARAGAGRDLAEAQRPAIFQAGGLRIGVIGLTDNMLTFTATPARAGTNRRRIDARAISNGLLDAALQELELANVDTVVLSVHWGPNLRTWPPARFQRFARAAIDRGVDIVHGHSAHLFQGVEAYRDGLILYDTGDILDDYWVFPGIRTDHSFVFLVDLDGGRPVRLSMRPVVLQPGRADLATGEVARTIMRTMRRRCRPFGTTLNEADGDLIVECGRGAFRPAAMEAQYGSAEAAL
jgi:poly-gamma-glutamate capsule biosynthesis protein CapA/YwtB (metallophosphatase superfamily)